MPHFDAEGRFLLPDFDQARPFSSFLPGIAGRLGVPMWVFYVNRGQGIASFGIENKDSPVLEFQPANKAYRLTPTLGFRTFCKLRGRGRPFAYEPFAPWSPGQPHRRMHIGMNELELVERNEMAGISTRVEYFTLVGEPEAALVRQITLTNTGNGALDLELLDGLPNLIPFGTDDDALKTISRTIEAWMQAEGHAEGLPFYRLRASAADSAEVRPIVAGHFALGFSEQDGRVQHLPVVVDPALVFAHDTSLHTPAGFLAHSLDELLAAGQSCSGKTPSALFGSTFHLSPTAALTLTTLYGHTSSRTNLSAHAERLLDPEFICKKRTEARALAQRLTAPIATATAAPVFDAYCRQTFLDNILRGGWPELLGDPARPHVYHIYSRKHGDLERDYNDFFLAAEYYSQGNGNFRDVAQNRRNDVWFQPGAGDFNIRAFLSLIQTDGYNPLKVLGATFALDPEGRDAVLDQAAEPDRLAPLLDRPFTPGGLLKAIEDQGIVLRVSPEEFLALALRRAEQNIEADFGEGYWIDHWTYLLDLIESYRAIYPDRLPSLLFDSALPYFDSPALVRPAAAKAVLSAAGPRQYDAVAEDEEKTAFMATRPDHAHWSRADHGLGQVFRSSAVEKLLLLGLLKFATRDPWGMGVEMEAGKPGWYDALNGLPGLFGSSMPESYELLRLLRFLIEQLDARPPGGADADSQKQEDASSTSRRSMHVPIEAGDLLWTITTALDTHADLALWQTLSAAREDYRARTRFGFAGETMEFSAETLLSALRRMQNAVEAGIARAEALGDGLPPTYFAWDVTEYELRRDELGEPLLDDQGQPLIRPISLHPRPLPHFLEGPARALKTMRRAAARTLHAAMLAGDLYDAELGMFKVNASLAGQPHDIGRARAFTPGWLENESVFLHMHYKYLLEVLRAGLFDEFFAAARTGLIPFHDPARYGRSPLENSSFLVSSAHPDASLHGQGFIARLSGATAEFIHMWTLIMAGPRPFALENGELTLRLRPALPGWLFDDEGRVSFTFLGQCPITYHNPDHRDLFPGQPARILLTPTNGDPLILPGPDIPGPYAERVRDGDVARIDVHFMEIE